MRQLDHHLRHRHRCRLVQAPARSKMPVRLTTSSSVWKVTKLPSSVSRTISVRRRRDRVESSCFSLRRTRRNGMLIIPPSSMQTQMDPCWNGSNTDHDDRPMWSVMQGGKSWGPSPCGWEWCTQVFLWLFNQECHDGVAFPHKWKQMMDRGHIG